MIVPSVPIGPGQMVREADRPVATRRSQLRFREPVTAIIALLMGSVNALAQGASISAVVISAGHWLLGDPLTGVTVSVIVPRRDERLTLRYEAARLRGSAERIGMACAGFIQPGTCQSEHLRDESRLASASGGAVLRILRRRHAMVSFTADLGFASLRAETRGRTSGGVLTAKKALWTGQIGANAAWTPSARVPIALEIEGGIGGLLPIVPVDVLDGYTPFERGFVVRRFRVGVAWRPYRS